MIFVTNELVFIWHLKLVCVHKHMALGCSDNESLELHHVLSCDDSTQVAEMSLSYQIFSWIFNYRQLVFSISLHFHTTHQCFDLVKDLNLEDLSFENI